MIIDWLKSLRSNIRSHRTSLSYAQPVQLENRTLLSAIPISPEFVVNTSTSGLQHQPAVAVDADGDFVVTWVSYGQDGSGYGVYAQRYNAAGIPQGPEFLVNSHTSGSQQSPAVAMDADGDFVIVWQSAYQDGDLTGVFAKRFDSFGNPNGSEFQVNSYTTDHQFLPDVAMDDNGDFVVTWQSTNQDGFSNGVFAQRYDSSGVAQGAEFQVNTFTTFQQYEPAVSMDGDGNFVIAWTSDQLDGSLTGVFARIFDAAGNPNGAEFQVNSFTTVSQFEPDITLDADGDFVVTWTSYQQDGSHNGIYFQRFNNTGVPQGPEVQVNETTIGNQFQSAVAVDNDGDFVVVWSSKDGPGSGYGIYSRQYDSSGTPLNSETLVNTTTLSNQSNPAIAVDADGDSVIVWESDAIDGDGTGIVARRYRASHQNTVGISRSAKFYLDSNHDRQWNGTVVDTLNSFGVTTDTPLVGDWNGDGYDDIGVWRNGIFYLDANGNGIWDGPSIDRKFVFGNPTDTPIVGDWNQDGKDEIGVWRLSKFYLDLNGNNQWDGAATDSVFSFGSASDKPIIGDWNGDGIDDVGVRRNSLFYLDSNGNQSWNAGVDAVFSFGNSSDIPLVGDWDGDGFDDVGVWRTGKFYLDATPDHIWDSFFDLVVSFGSTTDTPLIGYWRPKTIPGIPPAPTLLPGALSPSNSSISDSIPTTHPDEKNLASQLATPSKKRDR